MHLFQTPFVRQNTPHPKELKAKAHKLFSKGKNDNRSTSTDEQVINLIFQKYYILQISFDLRRN